MSTTCDIVNHSISQNYRCEKTFMVKFKEKSVKTALKCAPGHTVV